MSNSAILNAPAFWSIAGFYAVCGAGLARYLWNCRTPIVASVRSIRAPKLDRDAVWQLSAGGDVGVV